jgi:hypothetical protein
VEPSLYQICAFFTVVLIGSTAYNKIAHFGKYVSDTREYMPSRLIGFATPIALISMVLEIVIILACLFLRNPSVFSALYIFLLSTYTAGIIYRLPSANSSETCACGGLAGDLQIGYASVIRNILFMIPGVIVLLWDHNSLSLMESIMELDPVNTILSAATSIGSISCLTAFFITLDAMKFVRDKHVRLS